MKNTKRDFVRNIVMLSIFCLINIFLIVAAKVPQLIEIKQGTNLIVRYIYFGVMLLYIAVIHVDYFMRKDKRVYTLMALSGGAFVLGLTALILL